MNLPMKTVIWHHCADKATADKTAVCFTPLSRYQSSARDLSSRLGTQIKRVITCVTSQFLQHSLRYSVCRPATARWTSAPRNASVQVQLSGRLARLCWTAIRSRALLSVALLVASPAKTGTFGNNSSVERLNSFISPLLGPLRLFGRGLFSCLNGMETRTKFRNCPIEGTAYV